MAGQNVFKVEVEALDKPSGYLFRAMSITHWSLKLALGCRLALTHGPRRSIRSRVRSDHGCRTLGQQPDGARA
jgi:hypothetical protein